MDQIILRITTCYMTHTHTQMITVLYNSLFYVLHSLTYVALIITAKVFMLFVCSCIVRCNTLTLQQGVK